MGKWEKLMLAGLFGAMAFAGIGCSSAEPAEPAFVDQTDEKERQQRTFQAAFAAAMIAESQLTQQFDDLKGLENGREVKFKVMGPGKKATDAIAFLAYNYWSESMAKREFEAVLADGDQLERINAAYRARLVAEAALVKQTFDASSFQPVALAADLDKLGKNTLLNGKFEEAGFTDLGNRILIDYKGLRYTMEKKGNQYRIVGKEGTLEL